MPVKTDMQRRRDVWNYKAGHADATSDEIAAALGVSARTVRSDLAAAEVAVNETARAAMCAGMFNRGSQMLEVHLARALQGNVRSGELVLAIHKEWRELFGLDAPKEAHMTIEIRQIAERLAPLYGLTVEEVIAEAERILRDNQVATS